MPELQPEGAGPDGAGALASLVTPPTAGELFGDELGRAEQYAAILATRGLEWGLMGPREASRIWDRHIINSLAIEGFVPTGASVIDVGSGAGLPGIPLALRRPDLAITLLEPLERRAHFLQVAVEELDLGDRVRVIRDRAETHTERYDVATCRAVAALTKLLVWTTPLFTPGGRLVALKGESAASEVENATKELKKRKLSGRAARVEVYPGADPTWVIVVS